MNSSYTVRYLMNYPIILSVQSYIEKPKSHSPYIPHGVDVPAYLYQSHQTLLIDHHIIYSTISNELSYHPVCTVLHRETQIPLTLYPSWCRCSCISLPVSPDSPHRSSCHTARYLINHPIILSVQSYIEKPKSHSPYTPHGVDVPACLYQSHQTLIIDYHVIQPDLLEPRRVVSDDVTKASHRRV